MIYFALTLKKVQKTLDKCVFYVIIITAVNKKRFTPIGGNIMAKNLQFTMLLDVYGTLLTEKQRETLDYYYNDDLSLGEISEETGITRQGVMNCIKKCEQKLLELESALGIVERFTQLKADTEKLEAVVSASELGKKSEILDIINDIKRKL